MKTRVSTRRGNERGAALVELAIALPILLMLVFGVVEFGNAYNSYISLRQGTREAARQGAVGNFGPAATTGAPCHLTGATGTDNVKRIMCLAKSSIGVDATKVRVKVLSGATDFASTGNFARSDSLIVCTQYPLESIAGMFSSIVGNKFLKTKTAIRIEKDDIVATAGEETAPAGSNWSWCTVSSVSP